MKRTTGVTVGLVLAGLLGLGDAIGIVTGGGDGPPFPAGVAAFGIGVTLLAVALLAPALRQRVAAGVA